MWNISSTSQVKFMEMLLFTEDSCDFIIIIFSHNSYTNANFFRRSGGDSSEYALISLLKFWFIQVHTLQGRGDLKEWLESLLLKSNNLEFFLSIGIMWMSDYKKQISLFVCECKRIQQFMRLNLLFNLKMEICNFHKYKSILTILCLDISIAYFIHKIQFINFLCHFIFIL